MLVFLSVDETVASMDGLTVDLMVAYLGGLVVGMRDGLMVGLKDVSYLDDQKVD